MRRFNTLDPLLQSVLVIGIQVVDFTIVCGYRGKEEQDEAYNNHKSTVQWPNSKHNVFPSIAVDVAPYYKDFPHLRWNRKYEFVNLHGILIGIAYTKGITLRSGNNWDRDDELITDQNFIDLPHLELVV